VALIQCSEGGKDISDKAIACPGCGCPVEVSINRPQEPDYSKCDKEELWHKAYNIQYKGKKQDLPVAVEIYQHIISKYTSSKEAEYAKKQLEILDSKGFDCHPSEDTGTKTSVSVYNYDSSTKSSSTEFKVNDKPRSKSGRILVGGICGLILGLTSRSFFGLIITTAVGAFVGTFDLPLVIFGAIIGVIVIISVFVMKIMFGI
jgi:hypothetical protein